MSKARLILFFLILVLAILFAWNSRAGQEEGSASVYGAKSYSTIGQVDEGSQNPKRVASEIISISSAQGALDVSQRFASTYPLFSKSLADLGNQYGASRPYQASYFFGGIKKPLSWPKDLVIQMAIENGEITGAGVRHKNCVTTVDPKIAVDLKDIHDNKGGYCGVLAAAFSIIRVLGVPQAEYANGAYFRESFLLDVANKGVDMTQTNVNLSDVIKMHNNFSYNGHSFSCAEVVHMSPRVADREADFSKNCNNIKSKVKDDNDCIVRLGTWTGNGHFASVRSAEYDLKKKKCTLELDPSGIQGTRDYSGDNVPVNSGVDKWEIMVGTNPDVATKFPFQLRPIQTARNLNTFWSSFNYKDFQYVCCKKIESPK